MTTVVAGGRPLHPWVAEGPKTIRFGVSFVDPRGDWSAYFNKVQQAEALGFDALWVPDHPALSADCWTTLAALAVKTQTIRLGLISCVPYRSPALLARLAADVDRLSNGRLVLGLRTGDDEQEAAQLGFSFPHPRERQQALEEAVQIIVGLWGQTPFTYQGKYFHVQEATLSPGCVQQPHVPILIAGGGERVTLRQVAQYADMANFGPHVWMGKAFNLEDVRRKFAVLRRYCEEQSRSYDSVLRSYGTFPLVLAKTPAAVQAKLAAMPQAALEFLRSSLLAGTPQEATVHYRALVEAGVQYFIAVLWESGDETLELLAQQVVPELVAA